MKNKIGRFALLLLIALPWVEMGRGECCAQTEAPSPLEILRAREMRHRADEGEVYLGRVLTLNYAPYATEVEGRYQPLLLELSDVLKTPLRDSYRLVLKGHADSSGAPDQNLTLSRERAEKVKKLLTENVLMQMKPERIAIEAYGDRVPAAVNETAEGRGLNRRVEIHAYGDVSEAVRFVDPAEEK